MGQVARLQEEQSAMEDAQVGGARHAARPGLQGDARHQASRLDAALGEVRRRSLAGAEAALAMQQLQVQAQHESTLREE
jgi:hypothetical protein